MCLETIHSNFILRSKLPERSLIENQVALTDSDATVTETLRVFLTSSTSTLATTTKAAVETTTASAHSDAHTVMVSPSEDTNLDFPWFMAIESITEHVYYVERESYTSQ